MRSLVLAVFFVLTGCSAQDWNEQLSTPHDRSFVIETIEALRSDRIEALNGSMEPELYNETIANREKIKPYFIAKGKPELITVSNNTIINRGITKTTKGFNYEFGTNNHWALIQIVLDQSEGKSKIIGWHVTPSSARPSSIGDFNFVDKGFVNYIWIFAMLVATLTCIASLVLAIRSKGIPYRWTWILGSLFGFSQFSLNWATSEWGIRPIAIQLLGSAAMRGSPLDAWVLSFSIPVVPLIFLYRQRKLISMQSAEKSEFN